MNQASLRGITWNHSRALPPLVATAQRFEELHPGIRIQWEKRSLHEFGHADIVTLAQNFDLLVIDHPMVGDAEVTGALADLIPILSSDEIKDLHEGSIGPSFTSYLYHEKLYALPIDAAAPAASFRPDLLVRHDFEEPNTWEDVIALASLGCVRMPAFCADIFLNFMGLCVSLGTAIGGDPEQFVDHEIGTNCLEMLCELAALMPGEIYRMNPIALYERMGSDDNIAYCPFAYTYSNYSRNGFGSKHVRFSNPVNIDGDRPMRTVLGGTGIAISAECKNATLALKYSRFVAGEICQRTIYGQCGGQPARKSAWNDPLLNQITDNFFVRTADSIERAYVRPRYPGYVAFQERAGETIVDLCEHHGNAKKTLEQLNTLYRSSRKEGKQHV
jgi:multiple sugar transport system substrate-binding protein